MKSNKKVIKIGYISIDKQSNAIITEKTARATELTVYQSRLNEALIQGVTVNGRVRVRDVYDSDDINYVESDGKRFKVNSVYRNEDSHFIEIELGEKYRGK